MWKYSLLYLLVLAFVNGFIFSIYSLGVFTLVWRLSRTCSCLHAMNRNRILSSFRLINRLDLLTSFCLSSSFQLLWSFHLINSFDLLRFHLISSDELLWFYFNRVICTSVLLCLLVEHLMLLHFLLLLIVVALLVVFNWSLNSLFKLRVNRLLLLGCQLIPWSYL